MYFGPRGQILVLRSVLKEAVGGEGALCTVCSKLGRQDNIYGYSIGFHYNMTRELYALLQKRYSWCDRLAVSSGARLELEFWCDSLIDYNSQPIWHSPSAVRFALFRYQQYIVWWLRGRAVCM